MEQQENLTFGGDLKYSKFNACVGKNGPNDMERYMYEYREATNVLIYGVITANCPDMLIHPILYCARHYLELFMKESIYRLDCIRSKTRNQYVSGHSLSDLWENLKKSAKFDDRISAKADELNDYIVDYFKIDPNGEAFRYPFDLEKNHHLDDFMVINIVKFKKRFNPMNDVIDGFICLIDMVGSEYKTNSFICGYPRNIIESISKELPPKDDWVKDEFEAISNSIKDKYDIISNTCYSNILDKIKSHREFAMNIGINIPVNEITKEKYHIYRDAYLSFKKKWSPDNISEKEKPIKIINFAEIITLPEFLEEMKEGADLHNKIDSNLGIDELAALCAFYYIGRDNLYSEEYDEQVSYWKKSKKEDLISVLTEGYQRVEEIEKGMRKSGQLQLL